MKEQIVYFGDGHNLLGVLTVPCQPRRDAPTIVLLSAGLLHRVGLNRLHVAVARTARGKGLLVVPVRHGGSGGQ